MPSFPRAPVELDLGARRTITEFPPSTVRVLGLNLPGPGGGYLRILPFWYSVWALRRIRREGTMPGAVYVHPWELDPDQPRMPAPLRSRLRHYTGLRRTAERMEGLLERFRFAPMGAVLASYGGSTSRLSLQELQRAAPSR